MSNHNCHGDFFLADGFRYYRCSLTSEAVTTCNTHPRNGDECPVCKRTVKAANTFGDCEIETVRFANLPGGARIELPVPQ